MRFTTLFDSLISFVCLFGREREGDVLFPTRRVSERKMAKFLEAKWRKKGSGKNLKVCFCLKREGLEIEKEREPSRQKSTVWILAQ